jgi:luciferase-type oxidoreductase
MPRRCSRRSRISATSRHHARHPARHGGRRAALREPLLTLKSAATIDALSGGRLLLGVASGDRPVEYPLFGRDFASRGANFRAQIALLRDGARGHLPPGLEVLPHVAAPLPLLVAGLAQQTPAWIGEHLDGCLAYPGTPDDHRQRAANWRAVAGNKPYVSFIHLDLAEDPHEPLQRHRFGARAGRIALAEELAAMRDAGVAHRAALPAQSPAARRDDVRDRDARAARVPCARNDPRRIAPHDP